MVMLSVVDPEQSYCIPDRAIQDNLFLLCYLLADVGLFSLNISLVSLDQEKTFDWVNHDFFLF